MDKIKKGYKIVISSENYLKKIKIGKQNIQEIDTGRCLTKTNKN